MKNKRILLALIAAFSLSFSIAVASTDNVSAVDCVTAGGHFNVWKNPSIPIEYNAFRDIGKGSDAGVDWACQRDNGRAILFFTDTKGYSTRPSYATPIDPNRKVSEDWYVDYHVNVALTPEKDYEEIGVTGLARRDPRYPNPGADASKPYPINDVEAYDVAFCLTAAACKAGPNDKPPATDSRYFDISNLTVTNSKGFASDRGKVTQTNIVPRSGIAYNGSAWWTYPKKGRSIKRIGVKSKELLKAAKAGKVKMVDKGSRYVIELWNYRCYNACGRVCGSSQMYVTMNKEQPPQEKTKKATFETTSTVQQVKFDKNTGAYEIKFNHEIKRSGDGGFSVTNKTNTNPSTQGATATPPLHIPIYDDFVSNNPGDKSTKLSNTVAGTIGMGESIEVCQSISYDSVVDDKGNHTRATSDKVCYTVARENGKCPAAFGNAAFGSLVGSNMAISSVRNSNKSTEWNDSGVPNIALPVKSAKAVWAKPGDNIQFRHQLCAGAEIANAARVAAEQIPYPSNFTVIATKNGDPVSGLPYLFGMVPSAWSNAVGTGFMHSSYTKTIYSPSSSGSGYKCEGDAGIPFVAGHYQIPGHENKKNPLSCWSATKVAVSDAGHVIRQSVEYTPLVAAGGVVTMPFPVAITNAAVKVPYNYTLALKEKNQDSDLIATAGGSIPVKYEVEVRERKNSQVSDTPYRTRTKSGSYRIFTWVADSNLSAEDASNYVIDNEPNKLDGGVGKVDDALGGGYLVKTDPLLMPKKYNVSQSGVTTGYGIGTTQYVGGGTKHARIPADAPVGSKVCVASAVFPADSHNIPRQEDVKRKNPINNEFIQGIGLDGGLLDVDALATAYWRVSEPSCYTISKKPTIAVGGSSFIAQGGVQTSIAERVPTDYLKGLSWDDFIENPEAFKMQIGSWSEFSIDSLNRVIGMGSGASRVGGSNVFDYSLHGLTQQCHFSPLTYGNSRCVDLATVGVKKRNENSQSMMQIVSDIKGRYQEDYSSSGYIIENQTANIVNFDGYCKHDGDKYVKDGSGNFNCTKDGTKYLKTNKAKITLKGANSGDSKNYCLATYKDPATGKIDPGLSILDTTGNVYIDTNIRYGTKTGASCNYNDVIFEDSSRIPQNIIIADKVFISPNVEYLDTWIIANEIRTCTDSDGVAPKINADSCNKRLRINGPVMAKKFQLYRTHGGGPNQSGVKSGNDKATILEPAEIFNVGTESYLWATKQSDNGMFAASTYTHELPPRY